ncbi:MAG: hypothetical protein R3360_01625, partial [Alphaproteobacteria bacterium]|nr:hypothetical protein [Alphaproteobacteria bacterium]
DGLAETIRKLEELERDATGAAFMKTAHHVMEQLGSLAIDIDRIMETDIPERVWKQYHAGDTSAFARRLLKSGGRTTERRIAEKFETDSDFRKTVMSYMSQFERVIDQAGRVDKADALNAALLSSHIGKLYVMLARAVKRIH